MAIAKAKERTRGSAAAAETPSRAWERSEERSDSTPPVALLFALPLLWGWEGTGLGREARRPDARELRLLVLAGLCFTGDLALWHWSLRLSSVADSTLLTNFAPFFVMVGAWLIFRERITAAFLLGALLAIGGATLVVGAKFEARHFTGDLLALATAVCFYNKKLGYWFLGASILMGLARIFAGVHYPVDVLAGAVIGALAAWAVQMIYMKYAGIYKNCSDFFQNRICV